jgi:hypothetical protein
MFANTVRGTLELPTEFTHTFLEFESNFAYEECLLILGLGEKYRCY